MALRHISRSLAGSLGRRAGGLPSPSSHAVAPHVRCLSHGSFVGTKFTDLVVCVSGENKPGVVHRFAHDVVTPCDGNIGTTRAIRLGTDFALMAAIRVHADRVDEFEKKLKAAFPSPEYMCNLKETQDPGYSAFGGQLVQTYKVFGPDDVQLVDNITGYLTQASLNVQDLKTQILPGGHIGYDIFEASVSVLVPKNADVSQITSDLKKLGEELGVEITPGKDTPPSQRFSDSFSALD
ncbi:unnamed protein product [Vitrella brassicaformis CCMP3155]|uniref:ACT domain-containing protein n=1 Tax=Vitrella brassicaformis (strain CCMP3155) TaxID=1169540 RepID=A0A0G4EGW9_VITBC|nr:unnamed protein product [Vitrella brassicaformis CCMP3155]|eukprot:CEL95709.1 unnamed protein product [Vitrella brassicaformis CCMP3155]